MTKANVVTRGLLPQRVDARDEELGRDDGAVLRPRARARDRAEEQKNSTELLDRRAAMGTDFAIAEECSRYNECVDYIDAYGPKVLMIEYRPQDFSEGCAAFGSTYAIVLRDLDLVTPSDNGYVFDGC